jgi:hypothetical protein
MVKNLTVRLVSPRSLIRLIMPAPRLKTISANSSKIMIFTIIGDVDWLPESWLKEFICPTILLDDSNLAI